MAEIAKQIGVFIMALIIIGIPFLNGLIADLKDEAIEAVILTVCSAIDLFIVFLLINHCI